jgi:hypothetical protein
MTMITMWSSPNPLFLKSKLNFSSSSILSPIFNNQKPRYCKKNNQLPCFMQNNFNNRIQLESLNEKMLEMNSFYEF